MSICHRHELVKFKHRAFCNLHCFIGIVTPYYGSLYTQWYVAFLEITFKDVDNGQRFDENNECPTEFINWLILNRPWMRWRRASYQITPQLYRMTRLGGVQPTGYTPHRTSTTALSQHIALRHLTTRVSL